MADGGGKDDKRQYPEWRIALACALFATAFIVAGIWVYAAHQPRDINPAKLQWWAGSTATVMGEVRSHTADYRTALNWDLIALVPGYAVGLLLACDLGRRVFWTARFRRWAPAGLLATAAASVSNLAQDLLLHRALDNGLQGTWNFRVAEALSLVKFSALLVALIVGLAAIVTTFSRLILHHWVKEKWEKAASKLAKGTVTRRTVTEHLSADLMVAPDGSGRLVVYDDVTVTEQEVRETAAGSLENVAIPPPLLEVATDDTRSGTAGDHVGRGRWKSWWANWRRPALPADHLDRSWWAQWDGLRAHWAQGFASPPQPAGESEPPAGGIGICVSGGGIRSASVTLGALQALQAQEVLGKAAYLVSVSGGGYTTGGMQLAITKATDGLSRSTEPAPVPTAVPGDVFAPGTPEEDHLRRHSSYISDGPGQWLVALGVLFVGLLSSLVVIGLTVTTVGLAIGSFYRAVPIVVGGQLNTLRPLFLVPRQIFLAHKLAHTKVNAPPFPPISSGVVLAVAVVAALALVTYFVQATIPSTWVRVVRVLSRSARAFLQLSVLVVVIGLALPALLWASSWLTWLLKFHPAQAISVGSLSLVLSYLGTVAATFWRKRTTIAKGAETVVGLPKKGPVNQVLPNSMIQMIIMWICLLVLIAAALLTCGWVATSGLPTSLWALPPVVALAAIVAFVDQTTFSLHPFYRRRLASAFAVRRAANQGAAVAEPYDYAEKTSLSSYAAPVNGFPGVAFDATANITGQDRATPGRQALPFILAHDYIGGPRVGWVRTDFLEELTAPCLSQDLTVEAAVAISGAAFAAAMGNQTRFYELFLALSNARLGAWLPNPYFVALKSQNLSNWTIPGLPRRRRLSYFAREIFGIHPSESRLLFCTDGGHYENLGLVEVLRRRYKVVYCINASTAGVPLDDTLANAITLAREELGVDIALTEEAYDLVPGGGQLPEPTAPFTDLNQRLSKTAVTTGTITYPKAAGFGETTGVLVYVQAVLTPGMPYQLLDFPQTDVGFPRDSTGDQWFDSAQFDAYQELGRVLGEQAQKRAAAAAAETAAAETAAAEAAAAETAAAKAAAAAQAAAEDS
jgi:hypothetical protein